MRVNLSRYCYCQRNGIRGKITTTMVECVRHLESIRFVRGLFNIISIFCLAPSVVSQSIMHIRRRSWTNRSDSHTWFYSNLKFSISYYLRLQNTFLIFVFNRFLLLQLWQGSRRPHTHTCSQRAIRIQRLTEIIVRRGYTKLHRPGVCNHIQNGWEKFNTKSFFASKQAHDFHKGRFPQT